MKTYLNNIYYSKNIRLRDRLVIVVLLFFSVFYKFIINIRYLLYKFNILKSVKLDAYVISIGNLTTGGTGKTPVTCEIANYLNKINKKTAIISRGYGGKLSNKNTNIISSGIMRFFMMQYKPAMSHFGWL